MRCWDGSEIHSHLKSFPFSLIRIQVLQSKCTITEVVVGLQHLVLFECWEKNFELIAEPDSY